MKQPPEASSACKKCGKPIASGDNRGDLVAHMLQDNFCNCDKTLVREVRRPVPTKAAMAAGENSEKASADEDFCPRCGLNISTTSLPGSLTGYLFQDVRCKCTPEADFSPGAMTGKFWNLKKNNPGSTFVSDGATTKYRGSENTARPRLTTSAIDLAEGAIIGGAYKIIGLIGQGGMGEVYLAEHTTLLKRCALKLIPPEQVTEIGWRRFQQEARAIAKLEHINLVKVSDLGIHEGCLPFYAMEYIEGETLADLIVKHGPMPYKTALEIFMQVCDGVHDAHKAGVIHRDLKPANIMVSKFGERNSRTAMTVKILDFGLAKLAQQDREKQSLTSLGEIFGSPFYMSPEQCAGLKVDNRSDIYSIGCTLFECLTGQPPFTGTIASAIVFCHQESDPPSLASRLGPRAIPEALEVVMAKLLRKNPVERYQTLTELRGDLEKVSRGESVLPFYVSRTKSGAHEDTLTEAGSEPLEGKYVISKAKVFFALISCLILIGGGTYLWATMYNKPKVVTSLQRIPSDSDVKQGKLTDKVLDVEISHGLGLVTKLPADMIRDKELKQKASGKVDADDPTASIISELGREIPGMEDPHAARPKSADDPTPYSTLVKDGPNSIRVFKFPPDIKIGGIGPDWSEEDLLPATGTIKFRVNEPLKFAPGPELAHYPEYFKRFRSGEIASLVLVRPVETNKLIHAWTSIPGLTRIHDLRLSQPTELDAESLKIISSLVNLDILRCNETCIKASALAKMPFLGKLRGILLRDYADASLIVEKLQDSAVLTRVDLIKCGLTHAGYKSIAKMPSLHDLDLGDTLKDPEDLETLLDCPILENLHVSKDLPFDLVTLKVLQNFRHLRRLHVGRHTDTFDQLTRNRIKAALTNVQIYIGDVKDGNPQLFNGKADQNE